MTGDCHVRFCERRGCDSPRRRTRHAVRAGSHPRLAPSGGLANPAQTFSEVGLRWSVGDQGVELIESLAATRAALSERDRHVRSHAGMWALFREEFVLTREFDAELAKAAQRAQARGEASDYAAESFELSEAHELVATAERFVPAIEALTG